MLVWFLVAGTVTLVGVAVFVFGGTTPPVESVVQAAAAVAQPSRPARLCPEQVQVSDRAFGAVSRMRLPESVQRSRSGGVVGGLLAPAPPRALAGRTVPATSSLSAFDAGVGFGREQYGVVSEVGLVAVTTDPLSTFSIDVDTASYSNLRRFLEDGRLPPPDVVRIEELVNYQDFQYPAPADDTPFGLVTEIGSAPWAPARELVHIGLRSTPIETGHLPPSNLVFLLDVSGSMRMGDKLPLVKQALGLLVGELRPRDRVAIVVYAGAAGVVLEPTPGDRVGDILEALDGLEAGGSTAGGAGICLAYDLAREHFAEGGNNRVILATDGDFNVGVSSDGDLVDLIEWERQSGVYLTVLGFGTGNLQDERMQRLAQAGNGNHAYIDGIKEAKRALVEGIGATLVTVADDVKVQVEFNPRHVKGYRLIGYENRRLRPEEFDDDARDAGDLGAGHSVTALYEIVPAGSDEEVPGAAPLRYQRVTPETGVGPGEVLTVKVRYKNPGEAESRLIEWRLERPAEGVGEPSQVFRLAAAIAEFGLVLRDSPYRGEASLEHALAWARSVEPDAGGRRAELASLIKRASELSR